jgi:DNA-binding NtrC family response regulator
MTRLIPVRVLVVDDDDAVCRRLAGWLTEAAYDVVTFTDPAAGLEHAGKVACQLALVDLRLPQMDGVELVSALRNTTPRIRVVAMAAFPEAAQVIAAVRAGARDVLEKPIQPPALFAALDRQLAESGISVRSEEEYNRRLGARIRAVRAEANLTLNDVARACGLSAAQLSHIELGKTATSTWTLARIGSALNTPLAGLLDNL